MKQSTGCEAAQKGDRSTGVFLDPVSGGSGGEKMV